MASKNSRLIVSLYVILTACQQQPAETFKSVNFKQIIAPTDTMTVAASLLFDSVNYIKLETNPSCVIGRVKNIRYAGNYIFIHDDYSRSILQFLRNGLFVKQIIIPNVASSEFRTIDDFTLDESQQRIYIWNADSRSLYDFDFAGNLKNVNQFPFVFYDMEYIPSENSFVYFTQSSPNPTNKQVAYTNFIAGSSTGDINTKYGRIDGCELSSHIGFITEFIKGGNNTLISKKLSDSFYILKSGHFELLYVFQISNHIQQDYYCRVSAANFYAEAERQNLTFLSRLLQTDEFLYYEYRANNQPFVGLYHKESGKNVSFSSIKFDFKGVYTQYIPSPRFASEDKLIGVVNTESVRRNMYNIKKDLNKYREDIQEMLLSVKDRDNPILVNYYIKKP